MYHISCFYVSSILYHTSIVMYYVSCYHVSMNMYHISFIMHHVIMYQVLYNLYQVLYIMYRVLMHQVLCIMYHQVHVNSALLSQICEVKCVCFFLSLSLSLLGVGHRELDSILYIWEKEIRIFTSV